ncbi:hypothetical protein [Sphingomonas asaccharolytica]|uniref:hypothetical protein n=1 Tax=Sphingomonas asaccharolytica TaxID=40681 RepID=UPI00082F9F9E|nr:hypothetical protein [Sphingomonas asaccharolytica]
MNRWLVAAGILDGVAALLHFGCILGGPAWYRFFGAGDAMVTMAERGMARPTLITLAIAAILPIWGAYAFSGAGLLPRLPLLRPALVAIAAIFLARAAALPLLFRVMPDRSSAFLWTSSAIVLAIGVVQAIGLAMLATD